MAKWTGDVNRLLLLLVAVLSGFAAVLLLTRQGRPLAAQLATSHSQADILALPVEFRPGYEGTALIDKENYTICIYQYQFTRPAHERLVLLAARSFRYDRQLADYNTAEPRPDQVKDILRRPTDTADQPPAEPQPHD